MLGNPHTLKNNPIRPHLCIFCEVLRHNAVAPVGVAAGIGEKNAQWRQLIMGKCSSKTFKNQELVESVVVKHTGMILDKHRLL